MKSGPVNRLILIKIRKLDDHIKKALHNAFHEIGREHVIHTQNLMAEKKTGRIYIINKEEHQASAPGEAPAIITGALQRNVDYSVRGFSEMEFGDKSQGGKPPIGAYLEEGSPKTNLEPRPHIKRAVEDRKKDTYNTLSQYIIKAIK